MPVFRHLHINQSVPNNYLSLNLHLGHQHCGLALYSLYPASAISLVILLAFCNFTCFEKWNSSLSRTLISTVRHRKPFSRSLAATLSAKMYNTILTSSSVSISLGVVVLLPTDLTGADVFSSFTGDSSYPLAKSPQNTSHLAKFSD